MILRRANPAEPAKENEVGVQTDEFLMFTVVEDRLNKV